MENETPRTLLTHVGHALTPTLGDLAGTLMAGSIWWASGFTDPDMLHDAYAHLSTMTPIDPKLVISAYFAGLGVLTRYGTNAISRDAFGTDTFGY